jgi:hypothetical protein
VFAGLVINGVAILLLVLFGLIAPAFGSTSSTCDFLPEEDEAACLSYVPPQPTEPAAVQLVTQTEDFATPVIVVDCVDDEGNLTHCSFPEAWRSTVERYFPANRVEQALSIMQCESGGNPLATNSSSGAAGLFQHLPRYWEGRSTAAGWEGADIYNPTANTAVAAWLAADGVKRGLSYWHHWECRYVLP